MEILVAILAGLVVIAILFEIARRLGVPYPSVFVLGGLALAFVPGVPHYGLDPDLVLLVFLPPLLFIAATDTPIRELRTYIVPILRLAFGLVIFTMVVVGFVANALVPTLGLAAALTLGAIVAPTDALAATSVFRRLNAPRIVATLIEGEALFNDATALVAYRVGILAVASGAFVLADTAAGFAVAAVGGVAIGLAVGWGAVWLLRRLDDPAVEVVLSAVIPFAAYLPADVAGLSGVLAAVTSGLVIGSQLGKILSARTRVLWLSTWKMIGFVLNGFVFLLIGLELPTIVGGLAGHNPLEIGAIVLIVCAVVIASRFIWAIGVSFLPNSPRRLVARTDVQLAKRITFVVSWSGLRGAVSLAAALALPANFPERDLILVITFGVILVTLVGQGMSLPWLLRRDGWSGREIDGDESTAARDAAYRAGLAEIERQRQVWSDHAPLFDRLESGLRDRTQHLATSDEDETAERRQERLEHEQIQLAVIAAQRGAVIDMRDAGQINDETLREIERELDLEELRMEG